MKIFFLIFFACQEFFGWVCTPPPPLSKTICTCLLNQLLFHLFANKGSSWLFQMIPLFPCTVLNSNSHHKCVGVQVIYRPYVNMHHWILHYRSCKQYNILRFMCIFWWKFKAVYSWGKFITASWSPWPGTLD